MSKYYKNVNKIKILNFFATSITVIFRRTRNIRKKNVLVIERSEQKEVLLREILQFMDKRHVRVMVLMNRSSSPCSRCVTVSQVIIVYHRNGT